MAKIIYEVKQNQNSYSAAFGKWYAQIKNLETLNTRKLANHISEHGSIYTPDVVYGVLEKFRSCLIEMLLNSKKVKIEGLGTFYCTLENQKKGALNDVEMTQISLAWLLTKVESPIVGATKLHHIEGAVKSLDVHLTADDIRYLEEPYVPHNLSGVMAVNKPTMSEEPVWVAASRNK